MIIFLFQNSIMDTSAVLLTFFTLLTTLSLCDAQASISLISTQYTVYEGEQFEVTLQKTGVAATQVSVVVQVRGNSHIWQSLSLCDWRWKAAVTLGWMGANFSGSGSWPPWGTAIATQSMRIYYR